MAKYKRAIEKNIKKEKEVKEKKIKKLEEADEIKNEFRTFIKIIIGLLFIVALILLISYLQSDNSIFKDKSAKIQYTEILAGQTFNKKDNLYNVIFYDFTSDEGKALTTQLDELETTTIIYRVDLSNGFNKSVVGDKGNTSAASVAELKINGPTLIEIKSGDNNYYLEGINKITQYLSNLQ
jgi:hypothetical protein